MKRSLLVALFLFACSTAQKHENRTIYGTWEKTGLDCIGADATEARSRKDKNKNLVTISSNELLSQTIMKADKKECVLIAKNTIELTDSTYKITKSEITRNDCQTAVFPVKTGAEQKYEVTDKELKLFVDAPVRKVYSPTAKKDVVLCAGQLATVYKRMQ